MGEALLEACSFEDVLQCELQKDGKVLAASMLEKKSLDECLQNKGFLAAVIGRALSIINGRADSVLEALDAMAWDVKGNAPDRIAAARTVLIYSNHVRDMLEDALEVLDC